MLYQTGIVILRQTENAVVIPHVSFHCSWIEFAGSLSQNQEEEFEEASLIEVAECFILFEEFIKSRKMLATSRENPHECSQPFLRRGDLVVSTASTE
jgi:hypothetical protein